MLLKLPPIDTLIVANIIPSDCHNIYHVIGDRTSNRWGATKIRRIPFRAELFAASAVLLYERRKRNPPPAYDFPTVRGAMLWVSYSGRHKYVNGGGNENKLGGNHLLT